MFVWIRPVWRGSICHPTTATASMIIATVMNLLHFGG